MFTINKRIKPSQLGQPPKTELQQSISRYGFTLAEVLITLGIVGIISAMTIPALINNYRATKLRTQFNKNYSLIAQVFRRMEAEGVDTHPKDYKGDSFYKTFAKYLTNTTDCGGYSDGNSSNLERPGCYSYKLASKDKAGSYKSLIGNSNLGDGAFNNGQLLLPDGTLIFFDDSPDGEGWVGTLIWVDINGYNSPPNRLGYDFFVFEVVNGVLFPEGDINSTSPDKKDKYCTGKYGYGFSCTIRAAGNQNYFKEIVKTLK